jgi:hypothetical protein
MDREQLDAMIVTPTWSNFKSPYWNWLRGKEAAFTAILAAQSAPEPVVEPVTLEWREDTVDGGWRSGAWVVYMDGPPEDGWTCYFDRGEITFEKGRILTLEEAKSLANSLQRILSGAAE